MSLLHSLRIYENYILTIAHCKRPANVVPNPSNILFIQIFFRLFLFKRFRQYVRLLFIYSMCNVLFFFFSCISSFFFLVRSISFYAWGFFFWIFCVRFFFLYIFRWKGIFYFVNHTENGIDVICIIAWVSHREIENHRRLFDKRHYTKYMNISIEFVPFFFCLFSSQIPNKKEVTKKYTAFQCPFLLPFDE